MIFRNALTVLAVILLSTGLAKAQSTNDLAIHLLIRDIGNQIYRLGERTGGSDQEWSSVEEEAITKLRRIIAENGAATTAKHKNGNTPLIAASQNGYAFLVEELLKNELVLRSLRESDDRDLNAYDYAVFSIRQSIFACNPAIRNNVFAYVPLLVALPYYEDRNPYPKIAMMLRNAGAKADDENIRQYWLTSCKQAKPAIRSIIQDTDKLQETLIYLGRSSIGNSDNGVEAPKNR